MINLKNSLKKILAGAFGVIVALSPFQSCQCVNRYILDDIVRKNNFDLDTMPDYESCSVIHEAEEIERNIIDGVKACERLILEPDNEDNKNVLNGIRNRLNNDKLYYLMLGEAICVLVQGAICYINLYFVFEECVGKNEFYEYKLNDLRNRLNKEEDIIRRLIDFINNNISDYSSLSIYQMFFNKYAMYLPPYYQRMHDNVLVELSALYNRYCINNARFGPLVKNLCELLTNIYEECGATEEVDIAESALGLPLQYIGKRFYS